MEFIQPLAGFVFDGPGATSGVLSLDLFVFGSWNSPCSSMYWHVSASAQNQALGDDKPPQQGLGSGI